MVRLDRYDKRPYRPRWGWREYLNCVGGRRGVTRSGRNVLRSGNCPSPIDRKRLPGHERRFIPVEKHHDRRDLLGLADAADWGSLGEELGQLGRCSPGRQPAWCSTTPKSDGVHADPGAGQLDREGLAHRDHGGLRHAVNALHPVRRAGPRCWRRSRSSRLFFSPSSGGRPDARPRSSRPRLISKVLSHAAHSTFMRRSEVRIGRGVVNHDVGGETVSVERGVELGDGGGGADVTWPGDDRAGMVGVDLLGRLVKLVGLARGDHDPRALTRERGRGGRADATAAAGDERRLPCQSALPAGLP